MLRHTSFVRVEKSQFSTFQTACNVITQMTLRIM
jgi:hypothetical protein